MMNILSKEHFYHMRSITLSTVAARLDRAIYLLKKIHILYFQIGRVYLFIHLIFILCISPFTLASNNLSQTGLAKLDQIIGIIKEKHVKTISEEELIEAAANGILTSLDSHSYFYNNKDWKELKTYTIGEFSGIGLEIQIDKGKVFVITPLANSPAAKAGILPGDRIISINDLPTDGMSKQQIIKTLLGKANTKVFLEIIREKNSLNPIRLSIIRKKVQLPSVESKFFQDGVFYLKIAAFYETTSRLMRNITNRLEMLQAENKLKGVIIDLRNNPGGLLDQAVNVASVFIEKGIILSTFSPKTKENTKYFSKTNLFKLNKNIPIIVLVNKGTASAAEVLAGALKDHKRAIVIGEKSFGKGSVQMFIPIKNEGVIGITTELYKTPSGEAIEKIGVSPDINLSKNNYGKIKKIQYQESKISKKEKDDFLESTNIINKAIEIINYKDNV